MYTFSRASYLALVVGVFLLGIIKDRKLILVVIVFLCTWEAIVPVAVTQRVNMTTNSSGQLEASAQERVDLWENAKKNFFKEPVFGMGYASFQLGEHVDNLKDTHNWYVKVLLETGIIGGIIAFILLQQMLALAYRLFRRERDPLYQGFGLGLFLLICTSIVLNCFGDRWTYLEINGLLWALMGTAVSIPHFAEAEPTVEGARLELDSAAAVNPYLAYH
jgi:O-antigen ligase